MRSRWRSTGARGVPVRQGKSWVSRTPSRPRRTGGCRETSRRVPAFAAADARGTDGAPASLARTLIYDGRSTAAKAVCAVPGEFTRTLKDRKIIMTRRQRILSSAVAVCLGSGLLQAAVGPPAASYLRFFEVERKS